MEEKKKSICITENHFSAGWGLRPVVSVSSRSLGAQRRGCSAQGVLSRSLAWAGGVAAGDQRMLSVLLVFVPTALCKARECLLPALGNRPLRGVSDSCSMAAGDSTLGAQRSRVAAQVSGERNAKYR